MSSDLNKDLPKEKQHPSQKKKPHVSFAEPKLATKFPTVVVNRNGKESTVSESESSQVSQTESSNPRQRKDQLKVPKSNKIVFNK